MMKAKILINPYGHPLEGMVVTITKEYQSSDASGGEYHMFKVLFEDGTEDVFHSRDLELLEV
jgi:hypothetical protein